MCQYAYLQHVLRTSRRLLRLGKGIALTHVYHVCKMRGFIRKRMSGGIKKVTRQTL